MTAPRLSVSQPHLPQGGGDAARLRRVLEDMALRAKLYLAALDRAGVPQGPLFATGGWSRSQALVELRASVIGQSITVIDA